MNIALILIVVALVLYVGKTKLTVEKKPEKKDLRSPSKELTHWAQRIGNYFLEKNKSDYKKTAQEIEKLKIQNIEIKGDTISIHTARPGLLIGRRGETITGLQTWLNMKVEIVEHFSWNDVLTPNDPWEY